MQLIKGFLIAKLFGEKDVNLKFKDKTTIYVGENGIGKTTVLALFYYTITGQLGMLAKYDFEFIKIDFFNASYTLNYEEIQNYAEYSKIRAKRGRIFEKNVRYIKDSLSERQFQSILEETANNEELEEYFKIVNKKTKMPKVIFEDAINYISNENGSGELGLFIKKIGKIFEKYKIFYFPTYRRIEEDASNLSYASNSRKEYLTERDIHGEFLDTEQTGELIQFGMDDVKKRLETLLNTIKNSSIDSFNTMTSKLLNQYLDGIVDENLNNTTVETIDIALHRVGSKVSKETRNRIIEMYHKGDLSKDKYLANLVMNIVNNYNNLKSIDNRIENFVTKCNNYLYNKKMIYDPSEIKIEIVHNNIPDKKIPLEKLSSGEKQLISTFSRVFLEDARNLIILFDEPELSLSLDWQKNFIFDLSESDNCKMLVSVTHSPFIFDKLFDETYELEDFTYEGGLRNDGY